MKKIIICLFLFFLLIYCLYNNTDIGNSDYNSEKLMRGLIVAKSKDGALISWRSLKNDSENLRIELYKNNEFLKAFSFYDSTDYFDFDYDDHDGYYIKIIDGDVIQKIEPEVIFDCINNGISGAYMDVPLDIPKPQLMPNGDIAFYSPNDVVAYDVDNDGMYEFIVKWDPSNSKDNSLRGYTGNVYIDCYKLNGRRLWRIDMGVNIRAGASYTQILVYDYDHDNKAEMILKTADGTIDNYGNIVGNSFIDNRNEDGLIVKGNEYLTLFDAVNGKILDTIDYYPKRGDVNDWGDSYGNRSDRFLATTLYLDGKIPSAVFVRGIYTRIVAVTYNVVNKKLRENWIFDTNNFVDKNLEGNANHQIMPADIDDDGKDEIIFGSLVLDDDGTILNNINLGHGDALHVGDFDLENDGLEIFMCHENEEYGISLRDGKTGTILFRDYGLLDTGRCLIDHLIDDDKLTEMVGSHNTIVFNNKGEIVDDWNLVNLEWKNNEGNGINFLIYWDGKLDRELMDGIQIKKYAGDILFIGDGVKSINETKSNPSLSADLFGDFREEVIFPTFDDKKLRIFTTTFYSPYKVYTLMQNKQYKLQVLSQNVGYNQPPHLDYFLSS